MKITERTDFIVGEEATITRILSDDDILMYARIFGDDNPLHTNEEYAKGTFYGGRIAHGMLVAGLISTLLGTVLPGPGSIYSSQQLQFFYPVRPGDQITARVKVIEWDPDKGRITLQTEAKNQDKITVITGEAILAVPSVFKGKIMNAGTQKT